MQKVHPAAWIGLIINVILAVISATELQDLPFLPPAMFIAAALSAVGIGMLSMGNPLGGILGAIGGAIFAPIGLICVYGCMRSRQSLKDLTNNLDSALVSEVFGDTEKNASSSPAASPPAASSAATPTAKFLFKDERVPVVLMSVGGVVLLLFVSASRNLDFPPSIGLIITIGVLYFWGQTRLAGMSALALYDDHLTCVSSKAMWAGETIVAYNLIKDAGIAGNKGRITALRNDGSGSDNITILFNAMPGDVRDSAKKAFAAKMRELGVPFTE